MSHVFNISSMLDTKKQTSMTLKSAKANILKSPLSLDLKFSVWTDLAMFWSHNLHPLILP